jgi:organic radical activating enzyme
MSLYQLIDNKVIDYAEIIICLFEHCNLTCAFCPQDHNSLIGVSQEKILGKVPRIVNWIKDNKRSTQFKIHLMGGELFQDIWIEQNFIQIYQELIDQIRSQVDSDKELVFNFITNLVFDNTQEVMDFLVKNDLKVSVSYDSKGRFNKSQLETFKKNIEIFKDRIEMISLVMTRQNMEAVIAGDDYFDYLYNNFLCDWDSFLPSVNSSEVMMPKESDLLKFYKHLVDRYPNCLNIEYFTKPEYQKKMSCTRGNNFTIMHDDTTPQGCSGTILLKDKTTKDLASEQIVINFFKEYNCFECEYFKKCPFTCFIKNDYNKLNKDVGECVFKLTFKYVEQKNGKKDNTIQ